MKHALATNDSISAQLRARRRAAGLSLSQLAQRADTSPATLSRYEHGWQRFELQTLRKMAGALGCRLRVELEPLAEPPRSVAPEMVRRKLTRLFWDKPLRAADLAAYPEWVVKRVLEWGTLDDVRLLISFMGRKRFLAVVAGARFSSPRTQVFWRAMLAKENIPCMKKSCRETVAGSWAN